MKKFLLLTLIGALSLAASPSAKAVTVDDLDGKICAQYFMGGAMQYGLPAYACVGKFAKVNNNTLVIKNFLGEYSVDAFTLSNNTLTLNLGNNRQVKEFYKTENENNSYYNLSMYPVNLGNSFTQSGYYYTGYSINTSSNSAYNLSATYQEDDNGGYFDFRGKYISAEEWEGDTEAYTNVYYGFLLRVVEPNAIVNEDGDIYDGYFDVNGNTITFKNLLNLAMYENTNPTTSSRNFNLKNNITATINNNGDFTIPAQKIGGDFDVTYIGYGTLIQGYTVGYWWGSQRTPFYDIYMGSNGKTGNISGHIDRNVPIHQTSSNRWVNDSKTTGATLKTYLYDIVKIGKVTLYSDYAGNLGTSNNTTYTKQIEGDYTHQVNIGDAMVNYGPVRWEDGNGNVTYDGNVLWIQGGIEMDKRVNSDYVDHYELHMIPGLFESVTTSNVDATVGLKGAMNISDKKYWTGYNSPNVTKKSLRPLANENNMSQEDYDREAEEANSNGYFNLFITDDDMTAAGVTPDNNNYSLFIKTVYKPESGLEPTFHALRKFSDTYTTTGIEDVVTDGNSNEDAPVVYYNMNGVQMNGDNLTPGIYIKRQGNSATKVVIK